MSEFKAKKIEAGVYEYRGYRIDGRIPDSMLGIYAKWRVYYQYTLLYKVATLAAAKDLINRRIAGELS